jgi:hypothetical protein
MKRAVCMLIAWTLAGCGGQTRSKSDSDRPADFTLCDTYRTAMMTSRTCRKPDERLVAAVYDECARRVETAPSDCQGSLERMYACAGRALACSEAIPTDAAGVHCSAEDRAYAECVSGGTCSRSGGGQHRPPTPDRPASTFMSDEVCQCLAEPWEAGASGETCHTWDQCSPVCCSCPGSSYQYTAAACDLAGQTGDSGLCPTADRVCALTEERCAFAAP